MYERNKTEFKELVCSTGQRNGSIKGISGRLKAKRFPRPRIRRKAT
jgi:hypothetical protein